MLPVPVPRDGPGDRGPRNTGPELAVSFTGASHAALTPSPYGGDGVSVQSGEAGSPVSRPCAA